MSGWRKKVLPSLSKAQLTNTSSGTAWQSPACFPPLPNSPLPSVACLQHEVSCQTEQFCLEQSMSSYVHLVSHGRSADCAGSPIDCSNWVQQQLYSFHFLYSAWCLVINSLIQWVSMSAFSSHMSVTFQSAFSSHMSVTCQSAFSSHSFMVPPRPNN